MFFLTATEENLFVELSCHGKDAEALLELLVDTLDEERKNRNINGAEELVERGEDDSCSCT